MRPWINESIPQAVLEHPLRLQLVAEEMTAGSPRQLSDLGKAGRTPRRVERRRQNLAQGGARGSGDSQRRSRAALRPDEAGTRLVEEDLVGVAQRTAASRAFAGCGKEAGELQDPNVEIGRYVLRFGVRKQAIE